MPTAPGASPLQEAIIALHTNTRHSQRWHDENSTSPWLTTIEPLTSYSSLEDITTGTGRTIFTASLLPAILSAQHEVILTTCFWAASPTLDLLVDTLQRLSQRIISTGARKIKVYICFSSRSLLQKLLHTSNITGHVYKPNTWASQLGLPKPSELPGLDLHVQSLFFRPISVLHSKYLILDRRDVWFPSANVSWEEWFECCVHMRGPIVDQVFSFWKMTWDRKGLVGEMLPLSRITSPIRATHSFQPGLYPLGHIQFPPVVIRTTLLPHHHHTSLRQNLWILPPSWNPPPATPLNVALEHLLAQAQSSIIMLTPNLTCAPVYNALVAALKRGVAVRVITNRRMMILEQLLTSGSVTEFWLWRLARAYRRMQRVRIAEDTDTNNHHALGKLMIEYFRPSRSSVVTDRAAEAEADADADANADAEADALESGLGIASAATKTHIKLTLIDRETIVLGSGNMDRASWYTSQELGIMVQGREHVGRIWDLVERGLDGCLEGY